MSMLQGAHRFDALVVGTANRTAVTAGRAVASAPGSAYNPLLIYARPGMGKTHLLGAIAHEVFAVNPAARIEFLTLDEFVEGFHVALSTGQSDRFRARFGDADLLLVDDIQFLSRQREMQSELLRVLDVMLAGQKQVVLTSDRAPSEIESLDDRLLTRFAGGLVLDIARPDYETRVAILHRKAEERGATFPDDVLEAVASLDIESVRELVGAVNRLVAFQAVSEVPIDAAQARLLIGGLQSAVADDLVVEQAETLEFAGVGHGEMAHAGGDARRLAADALPGVMLGQSDMLGGGPVDELPSHDERMTTRPTTSGWQASRTSMPIRTSSPSRRRAITSRTSWVRDSPTSRRCRPTVTSSAISCPTSRPRWRDRWIRGARGWARQSCAGKARASAPTGWSGCWKTRSRPIPSR